VEESRTAGRAIVDVLHAEGVRQVFGLPGGHVLSIYDALHDSPEIATYLVRHEFAAAAMAAGYAQLTSEPGVCVVTAGPGCTNLLTAVAEAYVGCLPMVLFAGRGATVSAQRGASQEVATEQIFAPVTKWSVRVDRPDHVVPVVRRAFAEARSGRPGPVLVDLPRDILDSEVADAPYVPVAPPTHPSGDAAAVDAAAEALSRAERPLIVAGGGAIASGAADEVRALAERLAAPVLTTLAGRGIIPDDHPLSLGGLGAHHTRLSQRLLLEADVVLGLGCRFEEMETNWSPTAVPSKDATYIQVDVHAPEIGRSVPAQIGIVGDVAAVVTQLLPKVETAAGDSARVDAAAAELAEIEAEFDRDADSDMRPMHPFRPIRALRSALPRGAVTAIDVGCLAQHMVGVTPYYRVFEPRTLIVPSSFYGMGFAAAAAPAARIAHPDRPAVCFVGDGSFQMVMNVLPVAAEYELGVTWCVLNDNALGSIRDTQVHRFGERIVDTEFTVQPDFALIARACGCHGERVEDAADLEGAVKRALEANEGGTPAVLDVLVSPERVLGTLEHFSFYPQEMIEAARAGRTQEPAA
jgi:acetolactate synthase I/II/III large subunit